ncbi:MAG: hypothetical protein G01um101448_58 [Parcubacteria group bacterium Gr01-1014_48]|nr:MAG: hypothetical protein Greene041614_140 [Parcubacteria group bacterium Greene0416_14]TSC74539.1 MAG: hypothetical protein G01um101448_58 [Parcubacteria group bacterium Gr01-1014_48]TSD01415.1 MAG: hypothetical protein Greene101415_262 [Parcubacteria group bacterium Greene1014_15]TSD08443.1 MAG: hypothetical protein Greene07144_73 [Parcubacteria group bacterium Greene0714_4]
MTYGSKTITIREADKENRHLSKTDVCWFSAQYITVAP